MPDVHEPIFFSKSNEEGFKIAEYTPLHHTGFAIHKYFEDIGNFRMIGIIYDISDIFVAMINTHEKITTIIFEPGKEIDFEKPENDPKAVCCMDTKNGHHLEAWKMRDKTGEELVYIVCTEPERYHIATLRWAKNSYQLNVTVHGATVSPEELEPQL